MSITNSQFNPDILQLKSKAEGGAPPRFSGSWCAIELQPDAFAPQRFTIGVAVQTAGDRLHFKLLDDFRKFECIYQDTFPQRSIREILAHAESTLRNAVQSKRTFSDVAFDTECLSLSPPVFTSGHEREETVERLFAEIVVMGQPSKRPTGGFESIDTAHARQLVNTELKRIAHLDFERIVNPNSQGILLEENGVRHFLDLNLLPSRACGSVTSAVYKAPVSVELNLLKSGRDLTTFSRMRRIDNVALFLLMPDESSLESKDYRRIQDLVGEHEWKLEQDGFKVVSLPSPAELAKEIYDWAKPTLT